MPDTSEGVQNELEDLTSPIGAFVRQRCDVGPGHEVVRHELYEAYKGWCQQEGIFHVQNRSVFGRDLRAVVPALGDVQRHDRVRAYTGVALRDRSGVPAQQAQQAAQQANTGSIRP